MTDTLESFYDFANKAGLTYKQAEKVRAYVTAAVLAERERCAKLCEARSGPIDPRDPDLAFLEAKECASAIKGSSPASQGEGE